MVLLARRRAIFRTDASAQIGGGHVVRCLTLAEHLIASGWSIGFACTSESLAVVPGLLDKVERPMPCRTRTNLAKGTALRWDLMA